MITQKPFLKKEIESRQLPSLLLICLNLKKIAYMYRYYSQHIIKHYNIGNHTSGSWKFITENNPKTLQ